MKRAPRIILALVLIGPALTAQADDTHYQDYPLGGRAVGLGGAFSAIANDPSGIFYNPAGIVDASRSAVQVSTNLYGLELAASDENVLFNLAKQLVDLDSVFTDLAIIPSSAGFLQSFGPKDNQGRQRHTYGGGLFVPQYNSLRLRTVRPGPQTDQLILYRHEVLDRTLQPSLAYAYRVDDYWRFGMSAILSYRSLQDREETALIEGADVGQQPFTTVATQLNAWVATLAFSFGIKFKLSDEWRFGGTVTSPSIHLDEGTALEVVRTLSNPEGSGSSVEIDRPQQVRTRTESAAALRLGGAYIIPKSATFTADISIHAPARYRLLELYGDDVNSAASLTLLTEIQRELVVNLSLGAEKLLFDKSFSVAAGLFTNFSSAPAIPGEVGDRLDSAALPDIDGLGGSLVAGFFGEHTLTRVGVTLYRANGEDVIPTSEELRPLGSGGTFRKISVSQVFVYFVVSSTFRY